jgi:hypothetical protein
VQFNSDNHEGCRLQGEVNNESGDHTCRPLNGLEGVEQEQPLQLRGVGCDSCCHMLNRCSRMLCGET